MALESTKNIGVMLKTVEEAEASPQTELEVTCLRTLDDGTLCQFSGTKRAVNLHRFRADGEGGEQCTRYIINNECHWCSFVSMSKGSDGAKKHMHRVLIKNGQCPSEEVSLRRKYSKEVAIAKVESYFCEHCKVQILDHENVMKHVGTHIEFCTGRASQFGRDDALWLRLEG